MLFFKTGEWFSFFSSGTQPIWARIFEFLNYSMDSNSIRNVSGWVKNFWGKKKWKFFAPQCFSTPRKVFYPKNLSGISFWNQHAASKIIQKKHNKNCYFSKRASGFHFLAPGLNRFELEFLNFWIIQWIQTPSETLLAE